MQEDYKVLYEAVGKVIEKVRKSKGEKYTIFCYENDIAVSSLHDLEHAKTEAYFSKIYRAIKALGLTFEEFGALLDKELPDNFMFED